MTALFSSPNLEKEWKLHLILFIADDNLWHITACKFVQKIVLTDSTV